MVKSTIFISQPIFPMKKILLGMALLVALSACNNSSSNNPTTETPSTKSPTPSPLPLTPPPEPKSNAGKADQSSDKNKTNAGKADQGSDKNKTKLESNGTQLEYSTEADDSKSKKDKKEKKSN